MNDSTLKVGIAQVAPVWLDRDATVKKLAEWIREAASRGCELVVFGEALIPGYPFWVERTDGARFESGLQKELYRHYVEQSVCIEAGDLDPIVAAAREDELAVYVHEYARTGFQASLNWYRCKTTGRFAGELELCDGHAIDVPACFISGASDWGIHQTAGALEKMRGEVMRDLRAFHLIDGAGHWVQQEQSEATARHLLAFLDR